MEVVTGKNCLHTLKINGKPAKRVDPGPEKRDCNSKLRKTAIVLIAHNYKEKK